MCTVCASNTFYITVRAVSDQGTWQFISAELICEGAQHDFRDDLESSVYVLLWMVLMYSAISDKALALLTLRGILNPQP
jgi:hypothetical protein